jgi:putative oxidoreductase
MTATQAMSTLRIVSALFMLAHGIARIVVPDGVSGFGGFLDSQGFPFSLGLAWLLTLLELAGAALLITGYAIRAAAAFYMAELLAGILLVHGENGWFVVGLTNGGMEYNVFLIVCFLLIFLTSHRPKDA